MNKDHGENKDHSENKRQWAIVAAWFGTIILIGLLKRSIDKKG